MKALSLKPSSVEGSCCRAACPALPLENGRLSLVTTCFGPRTEAAGFTAMTCPVTIQSSSVLMAARCCLTVGFDLVTPSSST